jgi:hypothetical protein
MSNRRPSFGHDLGVIDPIEPPPQASSIVLPNGQVAAAREVFTAS